MELVSLGMRHNSEEQCGIMVTGKFLNNTTYYDGYEDEPEIVLSILEKAEYNLHIWDGHFEFIFGEPPLDGKGWKGFTRYYNEMVRSFGAEDYIISDVKQYLDDLLIWSDKEYESEETRGCYAMLRDFLRFAQENGYSIKTHVF